MLAKETVENLWILPRALSFPGAQLRTSTRRESEEGSTKSFIRLGEGHNWIAPPKNSF